MAVAVDHDQEPERGAQAEEDEALLLRGVIRIFQYEAVLIGKGGLRFLEGDRVPADVGRRLTRDPR